jgi:galactose mutarotase-like enzyme
MNVPFVHTVDGFDAYGIRSPALEIVVVPELGAGVISLRSLATGREWMWRPTDGRGLFANRTGDAFETGPLAGAVDCLPTIEPCQAGDRTLPDHGEVWSAPWEFDRDAWKRGHLRTQIRSNVLPLCFERTISVHNSGARFSYQIRNLSDRTVPFLWAFHPLIAICPEDRIELPAAIDSVKVAAVNGISCLDGAEDCGWPEPQPGLRLDLVQRCDSSFLKLFANFTDCALGWVALYRDGERLEFRFRPREIPYAGLWFTNRGWHGYTHLAIEPTNTLGDRVTADAVLSAFEERRWHFWIGC